jgi:hypothetical protein
MLLLSLSIALCFPSQDLSKKVSFTSIAKPAKAMLRELSSQADLPLMSSASTDEEVLVLQVREAPIGDLMKQVALVTDAEWIAEKGGYRLVRSVARQQQQEREHLARLTTNVKEAIQYRLKTFPTDALTSSVATKTAEAILKCSEAASKDDDKAEAAWHQMLRMEQGSPQARLLHRLIKLADPREIAAVEDQGGRVVFSTHPTLMQRPFTGATATALRSFAFEYNLWRDAVSTALEGMPDRDEVADESEVLTNLEPIEGNLKKALLIVSSPPFSSLTVEVRVIDERNAAICTYSVDLYDSGEPEEVGDPKERPKEEPIVFSPLTKEFRAALAQMMRRSGRQSLILSPELRSALLHPEEQDPLSYDASDMVIGVALARKKNVVANLPDEAVHPWHDGPDGQITPSLAIELLQENGVALEQNEEWLRFRPASVVTARRARMPRRAFGAFLRASVQKHGPSIDDLANFAMALKPPYDAHSMILFEWTNLFKLDPMSVIGMNLNLLRLYGTLNASQRQALAAGSHFRFATASAHQKVLLQRLLFVKTERYYVNEVDMPEDQRTSLEGLAYEPTEILPNGIPGEGYFTLESAKSAVVFADRGALGMGQRALGPDDIAWQFAAADNPDKYPWITPERQITSFGQGEALQLTFTFHVRENVSTSGDLSECRLSPGESVPFKDLPQAFRDAVDKKVEQVKKMMENMPAAPPSQRKPPPSH